MTIIRRPNRLHHTAYVTKDLEATRAFYEDVIGLPMIATWTEADELFGKMRTYCHVFFELADGSALAFFQFADADDQAEFGPEIPSSPFIHIALHVDKATQDEIAARVAAARNASASGRAASAHGRGEGAATKKGRAKR